MSMVRIISLDGGGQLELTSSLLLQEIEAARPGFLARTQILAGTSAGAMAALVLASRDDPAELLPKLSDLWDQFGSLSTNSLLGTLLAVVGLGPVYTPAGIERYLSQPELLGTKLLGDLKKLVVVPTFQLDGIDPETGDRTWKAKVYQNFNVDDPDLKERAVSVCMRSGAAPVFFPIADNNFVDGGAVANNPAMLALSQVLRERAKDLRTSDPRLGEYLGEVRLLSIGVGKKRQTVKTLNPYWGFINWMLDPFNPLLLIDVFTSGSNNAIRFECERLLGSGFFRLNPFYDASTKYDVVNTSLIRKSVAAPSTQALIKAAIAWLDESGWMEDDEPPKAPKIKSVGRNRPTKPRARPTKRASQPR